MPTPHVTISRGLWKRWKEYVYIVCPECGYRGQLDHEIAQNGDVTPSVSCPIEGCPFHAMVTLEGWLHPV